MGRQRRDERIARNEVAFRRVNEAIEPDHAAPGRRITFVCECGQLSCTDLVAMTREDYEGVRTDFDRFLVLPGHEDPAAETVVEEQDGFYVVEKQGSARQVVQRTEASGDGVSGV
jgi:hypothetical protein